MKDKSIVNEVIAASPNRRSFLNKIALASAAVAAGTGFSKIAQGQSAAPTDADILNFALNLEYLEAEFYTVATTGMTIDKVGIGITGTGTPGTTTGGMQVTFNNSAFLNYSAIAMQIAADERAHVTLIRSALVAAGAQPIAKPAINLNALGFGFAGLTDFLQLARIFEDIGVTAYAYAAPLISDKGILGYAARIAQAEAAHSENVRLQIAALNIPTTALDSLDILPPPSGSHYFPLTSQGLTQTRSPGQVLFLAYGGQANSTKGGFFPNGANGLFNMSSTAATNNGTTAVVTPSTLTTSQQSIVLDGSGSTAGSGSLSYLYNVLPGGKVPALLQTSGNPKVTVEFVNGPGTYMIQLTVTDGAGNTAVSAPIVIMYTGT